MFIWFSSKSLVLISFLLNSCYLSWFYDPNKRKWKVQGVKIISMQCTILPIFHLRFKCSPYCCVLIDPWFLYLCVATWTSHWHVTRGPEAMGRGGNDKGSKLWQMPHWSSALPARGEDFPAESAFTILHGWGKPCVCHSHWQDHWCCGTQRGKALHSFIRYKIKIYSASLSHVFFICSSGKQLRMQTQEIFHRPSLHI